MPWCTSKSTSLLTEGNLHVTVGCDLLPANFLSHTPLRGINKTHLLYTRARLGRPTARHRAATFDIVHPAFFVRGDSRMFLS